MIHINADANAGRGDEGQGRTCRILGVASKAQPFALLDLEGFVKALQGGVQHVAALKVAAEVVEGNGA